MRFYLLFAAILLWRRTDVRLWAIVLTAAMAVVPSPQSALGTIIGTPWSDSPIWIEFTFGLVLAHAHCQGFRLPPLLGVLALTAGVIGLATHNGVAAVAWRVQGWGVAAWLIVAGAHGLEGTKLWRHKLFRFGGDSSYALFLCHQSAIAITIAGWQYFGLPLIGARALDLRAAVMVTNSLLLASLVHIWIEKPLLATLHRRFLRVPASAGILATAKDL